MNLPIQQNPILSFTAKYTNRVLQLRTGIHVQPTFNSNGVEAAINPPPEIWDAIWDTGATGSCISQRIVENYKLVPVSVSGITTPTGSTHRSVYVVNFYLPNGFVIPGVSAIGTELTGFDALIGMDIIGLGDFVVSSYEGKTAFSFRMPSLHCFDFVENTYMLPRNSQKGPSRNAPCPCGSGKKYKHCHGKISQK